MLRQARLWQVAVTLLIDSCPPWSLKAPRARGAEAGTDEKVQVLRSLVIRAVGVKFLLPRPGVGVNSAAKEHVNTVDAVKSGYASLG